MNNPPFTKDVGEPAMFVLTARDVEQLLKDDSAQSRVNILEKVSDRYNSQEFAGREREIAEQIFRLLMKDVTVTVREALSVRLKDNPSIPRDIMFSLAQDVEAVSVPVLQSSCVLSDADLVQIVEATRETGKLLAISQRPNVSERVSDALVETQYPQVVSSLLHNETAKISARSFDKIVDDFRGEAQVLAALVERKALPPLIVERLINKASIAVASQLREKYGDADGEIERHVSGSREDVMLHMLQHDIDDEGAVQLVRHLASQERLSSSLVMTALCRGQLTFFAAAMAHYSGITMANAKRLVADKGEFGFRGLYGKSGLPEPMFEAIRVILQVVKEMQDNDAVPGSLLYANRMVERVLGVVGEREIEYLPYFIALIRQNIGRH